MKEPATEQTCQNVNTFASMIRPVSLTFVLSTGFISTLLTAGRAFFWPIMLIWTLPTPNVKDLSLINCHATMTRCYIDTNSILECLCFDLSVSIWPPQHDVAPLRRVLSFQKSGDFRSVATIYENTIPFTISLWILITNATVAPGVRNQWIYWFIPGKRDLYW